MAYRYILLAGGAPGGGIKKYVCSVLHTRFGYV